MKHLKMMVLILIIGFTGIGTADAATIYVSGDIASSTTWTASNVYRLTTQIYVLPGATLNIEAGTIVSSTANVGGSLAVCRGAQIFVNGTQDNPVIMTSTNDDLANWHEGANEWGNLTLMGRGLISASHAGTGDTPVVITEDDDGIPGGSTTVRTNTAVPDGLNKKQMEGLTAAFTGDPKVLYGGSDDDDDSGSIHYLSLRYGGKVIGLNNELNGLSMGAIGRDTDIDHVEIMNNVDDGIEIWGGTVNLKYLNIWNVGDDSLDVDQGWRGKAQFGLIVQGYSADAAQGSGVGDNCFETDGAENSYAQPITTSTIYNFTIIGQPAPGAGDHGTAWRDNARIQYRNCIFMDLGDRLVSFDNVDGDGGDGYGAGGHLSWADTWTTPYTSDPTINAGTANLSVLYQVQTSGTLAEMSDCVFYNNGSASAYTESNARGVTVSGGSNPTLHNVVATVSPIRGLTRSADVTKGGLTMRPVVYINPIPINDAATSFAAAPSDGFFTSAQYRGGFSPTDNWLDGWTAVSAYGWTSSNSANEVFVTSDIATSTTWMSSNVYNLQGQVYVLPGATLIIQPGTVVQSTAGLGGSLAVCRGAKIYVNGTEDSPVIMTSTLDSFNTWHEGANEWGNLTLMGRGLISASHAGTGDTPVVITEDDDGIPGGSTTVRTNTAVPDGLNKKQMEGLTAAFTGDPKVLYGGSDDDDDSGSIHYLSLRYGGKVIGLNNELNGLSLGAIGRETEIDHVEIMNNVDDGIEIWGGTVNLKYLNIWNVGDDSLDVDQGWRGKAQFGLIVQGYSADAAQGSGVGDNCFETDGAENSYAQPITTSTIYNFTIIGQPAPGAGDHGTAWRDNARIQYRNCIFMDLGDRLVSFDNVDGDGGDGYGAGGHLSWADTWTTPYTSDPTINAGTANLSVLYQVQTSGTLAEMSDCVFYNNGSASAYTESNARGVTVSGGGNPALHNVVATVSPITDLTRGPAVTKGGMTMQPVIFINPHPDHDAITSFTMAPNDGFFTQAPYRGAFGTGNNWLEGWTAVDAYGWTDTTRNYSTGVTGNTWKQLR